MAYEKIQITPHEDIELHIERNPIELFLTLPKNGITKNTGLIFVVNEFGSLPDSPEYLEKLHPTLATEHNCAVASISYFGIYRNKQMDLSDSFIRNLNRIYNLKFTQDTFKGSNDYFDAYRIIAQAVAERGITSVDPRCQPLMITGRGEYQSWGFLPALDCLTAVGKILKQYPQINTKRLYAFGQYYGGYVASLMGKYAPNTFATIINKSGYSRIETRHILTGETMEQDLTVSFKLTGLNYDFTMAVCSNNPWTIYEETAKTYFSDAHRAIRSMLQKDHFSDSPTNYILFSEKNDDAYVRHMDAQVDAMKEAVNIFYEKIDSYENQSIQKATAFYSYVHDHYSDSYCKDLPSTDFSLNSEKIFDCAGKKYKFKYSDDFSVKVNIS